MKCPKCDKTNINKLGSGIVTKAIKLVLFICLFPLSLVYFLFPHKKLHVCRDCGFSWER